MQDIVDKFDRAKELLDLAGPGASQLSDSEQDALAKELMGLGIDAVGELVASARRVAVALETIAENTKPVQYEVATLEVRDSLTRDDVIKTVADELRNVNSPLRNALRLA
jgi:hypothetical protein